MEGFDWSNKEGVIAPDTDFCGYWDKSYKSWNVTRIQKICSKHEIERLVFD